MIHELRRALSIALPVLGVLVGIVRAELQLAEGRRFVLPITGFDPRDPLRGHYLAYRIALGDATGPVPCRDDEPGCALCLTTTRGYEPSPLVRVRGGASAPVCDALLPLRSLAELERYYIPEARAAELTSKLLEAAATDRARLVVAIDRAGTPHAVELWLAGERVNSAE